MIGFIGCFHSGVVKPASLISQLCGPKFLFCHWFTTKCLYYTVKAIKNIFIFIIRTKHN
uniref:Uncharacterized protein n=1 Tax=virus sp. ctBM815 TaxID=2825806 RepID=A0A8S5RKI2_9VIRU|nr:MAG TPA: hypothetical protein [virus sp. ctBM815]